jgi:tRNA-2-methylthio-N6-dimethylallyladenosine synthase
MLDSYTRYITLQNKTFYLRTFGCQMNLNDAERVVGMLNLQQCTQVETVEEADIVIFLTCCVREAADLRLMGQVASIKNIPPAHDFPRIIAVGGCIGQRDGEKLQKQLMHVDLVFGTHNLSNLTSLLDKCISTGKHISETVEESTDFSSELPVKREQPWHAWVPIMTGCNNFCTYCIVPYVRGREKSRTLEDIQKELEQLSEQGIKEITLLGQNVNSYGRDLYGGPKFADVLKMAGESGIPRVRFVTSHPKDLIPQTIEAIGSYDSIMPQLHLPLQSGSDRILELMNRKYNLEHYLGLVEQLRAVKPQISLSTDIIVGFPGETEEDFLATLNTVKDVSYGQVFTFIYSKREGTPAASWENNSSKEEIQDRFDRLVEVVQKAAFNENQKENGKTIDVLIDGASKRDSSMLSGKSPKNQTVHAHIPNGKTVDDYLGNIIQVHIDEAKTWYLQGTIID